MFSIASIVKFFFLPTIFKILANKDKDVEKYEADKLLFMETKDDDTTLLFSDSPETVEQDGILYQDTVKGDTRLLYYHLNGMKEDKKIHE